MKCFILVFLVPAILFATNSLAKGHGGGGGHGGGHSGGHGHGGGGRGGGGYGGGHSSARSLSGHSSSMGAAGRSNGNNAAGRGVNQIGGLRSNTGTHTIITGPRNNGTVISNHGYFPHEHWNPYPYYYYGYSGYNPFYGPYFNMWYFGANYGYAPHYYSQTPSNYENGNNELYNDGPMEGFVVYEHDTITGDITMTKNAVSLETSDSGKNYDYKFRLKQKGLQYVTVYNNSDSNSQLNLVRLKDDKRLLRIVHEGKLNIYDTRHGFIHTPEDIDVNTIMIVYNGQQESIHSSSVEKTKEWLTEYVNKAYNLQLQPRNFTWKELLIYIDKLD
jgi:hypothetical protein